MPLPVHRFTTRWAHFRASRWAPFILVAAILGTGWTPERPVVVFVPGLASVAAANLGTGGVETAAAEHQDSSDSKKINALLADKKSPITWVFTGDSITHGALHTKGFRSYPEHFAERVRWELGRRRDVVINTGISGDMAGGILADFEHRVGRYQPQVVSVMIGMNDCTKADLTVEQFEAQLTELVKRIRDLSAIPVLATTNTIKPDNRRKRLPEFNEAIQKVAAANQVLLVDNWVAWQHQLAAAKSFHDQALNDAIHPNGFGHAELARAWFRTLGIFDPQSPTCKLGF